MVHGLPPTSWLLCRLPTEQPRFSSIKRSPNKKNTIRWAKVKYQNVTDCLPGKSRCIRMYNFVHRVQFHFLLGLTWTQLGLAIAAVMILFVIIFSFLFLLVDPDYFKDYTAEKMGG